MWTPTESDKQWMRSLFLLLKDHAVWGTSYGIFRLDKQDKTLTLTVLAPGVKKEDENIRRIKVCTESIGWNYKSTIV